MSVKRQTIPPAEILLAVDTSEGLLPSALEAVTAGCRILFTHGAGANTARMRAVEAAQGDLIAFLDDDDEWLPTKLEHQLGVWALTVRENPHAIISSRVVTLDAGGKERRLMPRRLLGKAETVPSYLFRRRSLLYGEALLHTSTLLCDRYLFRAVPWDTTLKRHQDWDWVIRASSRDDVSFAMSPDVLVRVGAPDTNSVGMSVDWRASLRWLEDRAHTLNARERGDFLLVHTTSYAVRGGDRRAALYLARRAATSARPGMVAWIVWVLYWLPVGLADRLAQAAVTMWQALRRRRVSRWMLRGAGVSLVEPPRDERGSPR
jgi:glycosyltransferase involved in cell wall biosynthesis